MNKFIPIPDSRQRGRKKGKREGGEEEEEGGWLKESRGL
jgi:hypothetical protein